MDELSHCYQVLGLEPGSTEEQVNQAYHDLTEVWNPARFAHDEHLRQVAQEKRKKIHGAYELLKASFFEASIVPAQAATVEGEPALEVAAADEPPSAPQPTRSRRATWTALGVLALLLAAQGAYVFWQHARRGAGPRETEPTRTAQTAREADTTNGLPSSETNDAPALPLANANGQARSRCALSLNGDQSHLAIATTGSLSGNFTVECWALTRRSKAVEGVVGSRAPKEYGIGIKFYGGTKIHGDLGDGSNWVTKVADAPLEYWEYTWYHLAYVVTPTRCRIYVNGALTGSRDFPRGNPVLYDADHHLCVGAAAPGCETLDGLIAEVRVWQTARTQAEIQANMNRRLIGTEPGLQGYWRLDEGTGTVANDSSGHGFTGTLTAEAAWTDNTPPLPFR